MHIDEAINIQTLKKVAFFYRKNSVLEISDVSHQRTILNIVVFFALRTQLRDVAVNCTLSQCLVRFHHVIVPSESFNGQMTQDRGLAFGT